MKRMIALLISCAMLLTGCVTNNDIDIEPSETTDYNTIEETNNQNTTDQNLTSEATEAITTENPNVIATSEIDISIEQVSSCFNTEEYVESLEFLSLNDPELLQYVEDTVYSDLVSQLNSENYFVENVQAIYMPEEYYAEVEFNSQENIYFGYKISELNEIFQGTKYIFTLGENGQTTVQEMQLLDDDTYNQMIKNVAIGAGVILICVTVSLVTEGAAPAISMIFAASAKTFALSATIFGGVSSAVVKGIETRNVEETLKAAALGATDGFKWGAISGAVIGGGSEAIALKGATLKGLTMNEAAMIQKESKYPLSLIKQFKSLEEYNVYKNAGLKTQMINGKLALIRDIDLEFVSQLPNGTEVTNLQRMLKGYSPIDPATGKAYQLHHIGQSADGTLAVLTEAEHQGNSSILNTIGKESEIDRPDFGKIRKEFWKDVGQQFQKGLI